MVSMCEKIHEYLGMTIDFTETGRVIITMYDYVGEMICELPTKMRGQLETPASNHLFENQDDNGDLSIQKLFEGFHPKVAKTLFITKQARPNLQTVVLFLTTRVEAPNNDDQKKLSKFMKYLKDTRYLYLVLGDNKTGVLKWYVDSSFAIHNDTKSHTGINLTMGKGTIYRRSLKHKLNINCLTNAKLVRASDRINQVLQTKYFLECQGYQLNSSTIYQGNKVSILLERYGKMSSSKKTRHINDQYFFITNKIQNEDIDIKCMPSGKIITDYFAKSLQDNVRVRHE